MKKPAAIAKCVEMDNEADEDQDEDENNDDDSDLNEEPETAQLVMKRLAAAASVGSKGAQPTSPHE